MNRGRLLDKFGSDRRVCDMNEFGDIDYINPPINKKKRKLDVVALQSEFKRCLPSLDIAAARDLIDTGFQHVDELRGRSPEVIFDNVRKLRPETPKDRLSSFRMIVYYAETPNPDRKLLQPHMWL